ncbi:hypothetical protein [Curtobacterium sp. GC_Cur_3]|uniref:hypothetical protein n=1 Tax=Curtobacterium sp. GC_Cur_3 TaxID=2937372 RepID=UPI00226BB6F4|nr:hypothetical protein [Curtobacterium sp. GC_Cur_3]
MDGVDTWGLDETGRLVGRSYLWLAGVTAPIGAVVFYLLAAVTSGGGVGELSQMLWLVIVTVVATAVFALGGAAVALPCTYLLGRALRRVRSRGAHTAAHAVLAGLLALVTSSLVVLWFSGPSSLPDVVAFPLGMSVAAGLAAAIATWRFLRPVPDADSESDQAADADAARLG